jgi:hypothetical protein
MTVHDQEPLQNEVAIVAKISWLLPTDTVTISLQVNVSSSKLIKD